MDFTLCTKSANELFVFLILTVLGKAAETGRAAIQSLGTLVESLFKAIVDECLLKNLSFMSRV